MEANNDSNAEQTKTKSSSYDGNIQILIYTFATTINTYIYVRPPKKSFASIENEIESDGNQEGQCLRTVGSIGSTTAMEIWSGISPHHSTIK